MVAKVTLAPTVPTHRLPSKRQAEPCLLPRGLSGVGGRCLSRKLLPDAGVWGSSPCVPGSQGREAKQPEWVASSCLWPLGQWLQLLPGSHTLAKNSSAPSCWPAGRQSPEEREPDYITSGGADPSGDSLLRPADQKTTGIEALVLTLPPNNSVLLSVAAWGGVGVRPLLKAGGKQEVWKLKTNNSGYPGLGRCVLGRQAGCQGSSRWAEVIAESIRLRPCSAPGSKRRGPEWILSTRTGTQL